MTQTKFICKSILNSKSVLIYLNKPWPNFRLDTIPKCVWVYIYTHIQYLHVYKTPNSKTYVKSTLMKREHNILSCKINIE